MDPVGKDPLVLAASRALAKSVSALHDALHELADRGGLLAREDAMVELGHSLPFGIAAWGLLACAVLESFAAYPAAASIGLDLVVTAGIGLVIVAAVVGLAALIAHSSGGGQRVCIALAAAMLAVLGVARYRYSAVSGDIGDALASATALSLVSLVVLVISHALWSRMEPVGRWHARRGVHRAERAVRRAAVGVRESAGHLQRALDGHHAHRGGTDS